MRLHTGDVILFVTASAVAIALIAGLIMLIVLYVGEAQ